MVSTSRVLKISKLVLNNRRSTVLVKYRQLFIIIFLKNNNQDFFLRHSRKTLMCSSETSLICMTRYTDA